MNLLQKLLEFKLQEDDFSLMVCSKQIFRDRRGADLISLENRKPEALLIKK